MFEVVKITENADPDKYSDSGCAIGFDSRSIFSNQGFHWGKNFRIFGVDYST